MLRRISSASGPSSIPKSSAIFSPGNVACLRAQEERRGLAVEHDEPERRGGQPAAARRVAQGIVERVALERGIGRVERREVELGDERHIEPTLAHALVSVTPMGYKTGGWDMAVSATLHCLTGCAIGEIAGMAIGTAAGLDNAATVVLSIALAFVFGYGLTSLPLLRAGLALAVVVPIALASDTLSIATMEIVDNLVVLAVPGAIDAGLDALLFWGSLSFSLAVAFLAAVPVNRALIARGKGHAVVHETGIHGGPPVRVVGAATAAMGLFGAAVLVAEAL